MTVLLDISVIFAVSVAAVLLCHRLRIPSIVGFLLAGVLAGPDGLGLVRAIEEVEQIAEIGIILLLFAIGLEFSIKSFREIRRSFFVGGTVQMFGTALAVAVVAPNFGASLPQSAYLGFVFALSSTAIAVKMLQERAELESPHGRVVLGTLIYQDIAVAPLMLAAPLLAGTAGVGEVPTVPVLLGKAFVVVLVAWVAYRWAVPWLLFQIARTQNREAFLLGVFTICTTVALLTQEAGLSLALGAFLAGLIISESDYAHQAVGVILPFRDVFMSLFFVSVGMLLDLDFLGAHPVKLGLLALGLLLVKPIIAALAALAVGLPARSAVLSGMALGQVGEFSIVAMGAAVTSGLFADAAFQTVLDAAVLTMLLAPGLVALAPRVADAFQRLPLGARFREGRGSELRTAGMDYDGHIVIVGFGVTGRNLAQASRQAGMPYAAIEMNAEVVRAEQEKGVSIHFGDATHEAILAHVRAERARAIAVVINDPAAARRIVRLARRIAPDAFVIVRSRFLKEVEALYALGADEVIADELEVSIEVFSRVLARCLVPHEDLEMFVREVRSEWRQRARALSPEASQLHDLRVQLPDLTTRVFKLSASSPLAGKSVAGSRLRSEHGVTILAVRRGVDSIGNPRGDMVLQAEDVLFVVGPRDWDPIAVA